MKRRVRVQPDPDRIVVVPSDGAVPVVIASAQGGIRIEGDWAPGPEGSRPPAASLALLDAEPLVWIAAAATLLTLALQRRVAGS